MLAETDVHPGEYDAIVEQAAGRRGDPVLERYDEVADVLARAARPRACASRSARTGTGTSPRRSTRPGSPAASTRGVVGVGRRPQAAPAHLRDHAARARRAGPASALFVGDTWGPDVEGPLAAGMHAGVPRARRALARPGTPRPTRADRRGGVVLADLTGLLDLVDRFDDPTGATVT